MHKELKLRLTGVADLLLHNGKLTDPLNHYVKEMKAITGKQKKTDQDYERLSQLEWLGSLYASETLECKSVDGSLQIKGGGHVVIPIENLESMLVEGAKKSKQGPAYKAGVFVAADAPLQHTGPKNIAELAAKKGFRDVRRCKIGKNAVMRTRPVFHPPWSVEIVINYLPEIIKSEASLLSTAELCGRLIGLGDYRPKYGRFTVEKIR